MVGLYDWKIRNGINIYIADFELAEFATTKADGIESYSHATME